MHKLPISVVMPTFNGSRFVANAIRSVHGQTLLPAEIIIVDDCSTDGTLAIVEDIKAHSSIPITIQQLERNSGGPARPINVGVRSAKSEWITVLEQDDLLFPNSLAARMHAITRNPALDVVAGRALLLQHQDANELTSLEASSGTLREWPASVLDQFKASDGLSSNSIVILPQGSQELFLESGMFLNGFPSMLFRRSAWESLGGINESLRITGDFDFSMRLAEKFRIGLLAAPVYCQLSHDSNLSKRRGAMLAEDMRVRVAGLLRSSLSVRERIAPKLIHDAYSRYHWFRAAGDYQFARDSLHVLQQLHAPALRLARLRIFLVVHRILHRVGIVRTRVKY